MTLTTRPLGRSGMAITRIGFGSWAAGGGNWAFGWGPQDDASSRAAMRRALDAGVNGIDTAAVYGLGHSEQVVGQLLRQLLTDSFTAERVASLAADDWRRGSAEFRQPNLGRNLALRDALRPIARRHTTSTSSIAIAWTLTVPGVTGAIVGARTAAQVERWIDASAIVLTAIDVEEIAAAIRRTGAGVGPVPARELAGQAPANG